jgi:uncharacterized protein
MSSLTRLAAAAVGCGVATLAYGTLYENQAYTLRRFDVPVLEPGTPPLRLLHLSDLHIRAGQQRKIDWIRELAALSPDFVLNTGDVFSDPDAISDVLHALEPLFAFPGGFVPGNNDYYRPKPKNPIRYFTPNRETEHGDPMPWPELAEKTAAEGWLDLTHVRSSLSVRGVPVALAGTDDPHLKRARYSEIAGPADASAAVRIGVIHSPEPALLAQFAADGYDLVVAGHTHGGQIRVPFGPAIVTNCGIDRRRARWLHPWDERMYFHICAGLGSNPYTPIRVACRPEASLLTLVARPA